MAEKGSQSQFFSGNIANIFPGSPLNKIIPLMEDHRLNMEDHRLNMEDHRLNMEDHRLNMEDHRLNMEDHRLNMEDHRLNMEDHRLNMEENREGLVCYVLFTDNKSISHSILLHIPKG